MVKKQNGEVQNCLIIKQISYGKVTRVPYLLMMSPTTSRTLREEVCQNTKGWASADGSAGTLELTQSQPQLHVPVTLALGNRDNDS